MWESTKPRPRYFLRVLHDLLQLGKDERKPVLDNAFVDPKLERLASAAEVDSDNGFEADDRLT